MAAQLDKIDSAIYSITDIPRMDIAIQTLARRSMFWRPVYLAQSAWLEHIPFAFWLTEAHRPRLFVELGVHYGVSYFAFCQAVERLGLDTRCFGIDTFKGDEHAGAYGDNVFEQVRAHNELQYSGFSRIVRSTFDDALKHFDDGSVDLLHIDGLHTVDAVRHDFESWLPKLSNRAIVVMHDTNVRERNFGVFKLFDKLKHKYPHFEFVHGHGLGVLAVGEEQNELMKLLFHASDNEHGRQSVQEVFSRLGQSCSNALTSTVQLENVKLLRVSLERQKKQLDEACHSLEKKNEEIDSLNKELALAKEKIQAQLQQYVIEREHLVERAKLFQELRAELKDELSRLHGRLEAASVELQMKGQELAALIRERDESQRKFDWVTAQIAERDRSIADLNEKLAARLALEYEQNDVVNRLSDEKSDLIERLAERDRAFAELHQTIEEERKKALQAADELHAREAELEKVHLEFQEACSQLEKLREENALQTSEIFALKQALSMRIDELDALNKTLSDRIEEIDDFKKIIKSKDADYLVLQEENVRLLSQNEELTLANKTLISDKDEKVAELADSVRELADLRKVHEEKDALLQEKNTEVKSLEKRLADRFKEIAELTKIVGERELGLKEKTKEVAEQQQRASKLESELKEKTEAAKVYEKQLAEVKAQTAATQAKKEAELSQLRAEQQQLKCELQTQAKRLEDRFQEITALTRMLEERERALMEKDAELKAEKQRVEKLFNPLMALPTTVGEAPPEAMKSAKSARK